MLIWLLISKYICKKKYEIIIIHDHFISLSKWMGTFLTLAKCIKRNEQIEITRWWQMYWSQCPCPPSRHPSLPQDWVQAGGWAAVTMLAGPRPNLIVYRGWRRNLIIPSRPLALDNTVTVIMHHSARRTKYRTPAAGDMRNTIRLWVLLRTLW